MVTQPLVTLRVISDAEVEEKMAPEESASRFFTNLNHPGIFIHNWFMPISSIAVSSLDWTIKNFYRREYELNRKAKNPWVFSLLMVKETTDFRPWSFIQQ
ncbi:MAG: hypothetical protein Q8R26_02230 [bacterium]|nr:hypothetical protein [bacterium]